mmetsp:Transcript_42031/g.112025  ORF Transcript_42031/g.112025 Transcript_42031/m.112025 type:complete len:228 (+) Transcript_42031:965-1648(+)
MKLRRVTFDPRSQTLTPKSSSSIPQTLELSISRTLKRSPSNPHPRAFHLDLRTCRGITRCSTLRGRSASGPTDATALRPSTRTRAACCSRAPTSTWWTASGGRGSTTTASTSSPTATTTRAGSRPSRRKTTARRPRHGRCTAPTRRASRRMRTATARTARATRSRSRTRAQRAAAAEAEAGSRRRAEGGACVCVRVWGGDRVREAGRDLPTWMSGAAGLLRVRRAAA